MARGVNKSVDKVEFDRLFKKVSVKNDTGCWEWTGANKGNGYGHSWMKGKNMPAHRAMYLAVIGNIPEGLDLDHLCRNRCCVNPLHLEPVTRSENLKRGNTGENLASIARSMTACKRGHEFTPENTRYYRGRRHCRACARYHSHNRQIRHAK